MIILPNDDENSLLSKSSIDLGTQTTTFVIARKNLI